MVEVVNKAKAAAAALMKDTEQKCNVVIIEAESQLLATSSKYAALLEEGKAEAKNLEAFDVQRRHNYEIAKAKIYEEMASK